MELDSATLVKGVSLKVLTGKHAGLVVKIPTARFLIGRGDDCQLRLTNAIASRHHCLLLHREGKTILHDLQSRNGTYVNDQRIEGEHALTAGDRFTIGDLAFEVQIAAALVAKPTAQKVDDSSAMRILEQPQGDDADVLDWLCDEKLAPHFDTQKFAISETIIGIGSAAAAQSETLPGNSAVNRSAKPVQPAPSTKDSQEAATELLRKYLKSR